ncbi:MAG: nucleoside recognition domain-containing protein [Prosthecobacter sp.]|nr:nucleoside recognition domain-containing protein [Prosthecobacter sp.]
MLNYIWASLILIGILVAGLLGHFTGEGGIITSALAMSETAVMKIALPLAGMMMFWLGIMRLMEKAGLLEMAARAVSPVMRRLFPDVPANHPAMSAMIMNLSANMLGLGNQATPMGLKAMEHLQELNPHKQTASNAMVTFLALNTAAFTLIPMTAINYLAAAGMKSAYQIIVPTILATTCTTVMAVLVARTLQNLPKFRAQPDVLEDATPAGEGAAGEAVAPSTSRITGRGRMFLIALFAVFAGGVMLELAPPSWRQSVLMATGLQKIIEADQQRMAQSKAAKPVAAAAATPVVLEAPPTWRRMMDGTSGVVLPLILLIAIGAALAKGIKVYEEFIEGAKEGFNVALRIMPYLVAMLAALAIFRSSGGLLILEYVLTPVLNLIGFPVELLPLALMRPLSGSGSSGILNEILNRPEASEFLKYTAAIMYGSTETTFYVLAVYFGSVGVRKIRHALVAGLCADAVGLTMSVVIGRMMFT